MLLFPLLPRLFCCSMLSLTSSASFCASVSLIPYGVLTVIPCNVEADYFQGMKALRQSLCCQMDAMLTLLIIVPNKVFGVAWLSVSKQTGKSWVWIWRYCRCQVAESSKVLEQSSWKRRYPWSWGGQRSRWGGGRRKICGSGGQRDMKGWQPITLTHTLDCRWRTTQKECTN